jgi:hypothetical protein
VDVDKAITGLGERLDDWLRDYLAASDTNDRLAQGSALLRGIEIKKELDRIKAKGLAAVSAVLDTHASLQEDERVAQLVRSFEFGSKLANALSDAFMDTDGYNKISRQMNLIAHALDATESGRLALAPLLDHRDAGVRASAGAFLITFIPHRVVPILRDVEKSERGNSAHFSAFWTLQRWERDGK